MSDLDNMLDYLLDVARGDMPGPIGMLKAPDEKGPFGEYLIKYVLDNPVSSMLAYAPQARPLYEMILKAMNESEKGNTP